MILKTFSFFLILLLPWSLSPNHRDYLVLWNVGQGQWVTLVTTRHCYHIDMGGEFIQFEKVQELCQSKQNQVAFTHGDRDHISFLRLAARKWPQLCRIPSPQFSFSSRSFKKIYESLPKCPAVDELVFYRVSPDELAPRTWRSFKPSRNDLSLIWVYKNKVLIPGDSSYKAESVWIRKIPQPAKIEWLLVPHHGSITSSSEKLLKRLYGLKGALASCRRSVYGHPHPLIVLRYKKLKVPLLTTESWGNLRVEL